MGLFGWGSSEYEKNNKLFHELSTIVIMKFLMFMYV